MNQVRDVVVIGAALGGVTAIAKIALTWPPGLPVSVLIALATSKQPAPMVLQIIASYAPVHVRYAKQGEAILTRRIYLSPPEKHLLVAQGGLISIDDGNAFDTIRPSSNRLFASAALVFGPRVIGIILSGNTKDGAQGRRTLNAQAVLASFQDPDDAVEPLMPLNGLRNDHPRFRVKAEEIAPLVKRIVRGDA